MYETEYAAAYRGLERYPPGSPAARAFQARAAAAAVAGLSRNDAENIRRAANANAYASPGGDGAAVNPGLNSPGGYPNQPHHDGYNSDDERGQTGPGVANHQQFPVRVR